MTEAMEIRQKSSLTRFDNRSAILLLLSLFALLGPQIWSPLLWYLARHRLVAMEERDIAPGLSLRAAHILGILGSALLLLPMF